MIQLAYIKTENGEYVTTLNTQTLTPSQLSELEELLDKNRELYQRLAKLEYYLSKGRVVVNPEDTSYEDKVLKVRIEYE